MSDDETTESEAADAAAQAAPGDQPCMPCRGKGSVISNKGGSPSTVQCPWCKGTGQRIPGHDAQAHWGAADASDAPDPAPPPDSVA
jgi:DnaJ-class molecular chaperone